MKIGVPKEIKTNENRIALVPAGAVQAVMRNYEEYSKGSARAAARYDFRPSAAGFVRQIVAAVRRSQLRQP